LHDRIASSALRDLNLDAGIIFPILPDQLRERAAGDQRMDTDA
jgi:hypothetical protein